MNLDAGDEESEHLVKNIEVKNEELPLINQKDIELLKNKFMGLQILNLSMNKIANIEGSIDCPNLTELTLSDNLIKQIHPFLFSNLPKLQLLDLSINQINVI